MDSKQELFEKTDTHIMEDKKPSEFIKCGRLGRLDSDIKSEEETIKLSLKKCGAKI